MNTLRGSATSERKIPMPWGHVSAKTFGDPQDSAVLTLHGWMDNGASFERLVPLLSSSLYVVAVDLPGHGLSSHLPPGQLYQLWDHIMAIKRVATHFQWKKFSIIGHSFGAALAVYFSAICPELVDRVVMLDMIKPQTFDKEQGPQELKRMYNELFDIEKNKAVLRMPYEEAVKRWITIVNYNTGDGVDTHPSITRSSTEQLMKKGLTTWPDGRCSYRHDPRLQCRSVFTHSHDQCLEFLSAIRCHLMIIKAQFGPVLWDGKGRLIDRALEVYKKNCASFKYEVVEGTHFVHLNEPANVAYIINDFFERR